MTITTDNGEKVTRIYHILITYENGEREAMHHASPSFQHIPKGARQTCIGYYDKPQNKTTNYEE